MTVSILSLSARENGNIAVCFEIVSGEQKQTEAFIISSTAAADLHLQKGECTKELFDTVSEVSQLYLARKKALSILGFGTCSPKMLCRKLIIKGFSRDISAKAVSELMSEGYINSEADAQREAEKCINKLWGKRRIAAALFEKGYSEKDIKSVLFALDDLDTDYSALCAERIKRTVGDIPKDRQEQQKLAAKLRNYGFSSAEIKSAFDSFALK